MKLPSERQNMREIALFMVGMVVGSSLLLAVTGHDLEHFYVQVAELNRQVDRLSEQNASLKDELTTQKRGFIRRVRVIDIHVNAKEDFVRLEAEKQAQLQLKPLMQLNIDAIESRPDIVDRLLDGHILTIDNVMYSLQVTKVVVGETLRIYIDCKRYVTEKR